MQTPHNGTSLAKVMGASLLAKTTPAHFFLSLTIFLIFCY